MLDTKELKAVLSTLNQRRAWLLKVTENPSASPEDKDDAVSTIKLLDSSIKKLASSAPPAPKKAPPPPTISQPAPAIPAKKSSKRPAVEPENAYVLIAEDNHDSAELLRGVLMDMGIKKIDVVEDGRAAVYALQNCSPPFDIVLCDWDMPEMSGLEVRKSVKSLAKLQDTHFVMVTAVSEVARIREAISQGVNDYIVKPVDIEILEKKLRAALSGSDNASETSAEKS